MGPGDKYDGQCGKQDGILGIFLSGDSRFFDVFSPEIVAGDPKTCLEGEYSVALSENIAKKVFWHGVGIGEECKYR